MSQFWCDQAIPVRALRVNEAMKRNKLERATMVQAIETAEHSIGEHTDVTPGDDLRHLTGSSPWMTEFEDLDESAFEDFDDEFDDDFEEELEDEYDIEEDFGSDTDELGNDTGEIGDDEFAGEFEEDGEPKAEPDKDSEEDSKEEKK